MRLAAVCLLTIGWGCQAQTTERTFEVVSVKLEPPPDGRGFPAITKTGGPGTSSPTRVTFRHYPLRSLILDAFNVRPYQLSGPGLANAGATGPDLFEIIAVLPEGTTMEQYRQMLQRVLIQRFAIEFRKEKKMATGFELRVNDKGSKLKPLADTPPPADEPWESYAKGEDGFPIYPPGRTGRQIKPEMDRIRTKFYTFKMDAFAVFVSDTLRQPVVDRTGLTGNYTFVLEHQIGAAPAPPIDGSEAPLPGVPTIYDALKSQLGLRLVKAQLETEMLTIEKTNRVPSEN